MAFYILSKKVKNLFCVLLVKNNRFLKSFTLPELAIAISVAGIIATAGMMAYKSTNPELKQDLKKMKAIEDKLQEFFNVNGRLPFPARASEVNGNTYYLEEYKIGAPSKYSKRQWRSFSSESTVPGETYSGSGTYYLYCNNDECTTFGNGGMNSTGGNLVWGVVPTRALGLPDDYAYDSQGHNFEYIVDNKMAFPNGFKFSYGYQKANYVPSNDGRYQVYYTTTDTSYEPFAMDLFDLSIKNNKTNKIIKTTEKNTAYVILSKGKTNKCYWNNRATEYEKNVDIPEDNTKYNCQANYSNGAFESLTIYQGYSKDFDNIVKYKTLSELVVQSYKADEKGQGLGSNNSSTTDGYFNALPKGTMVLFYLHSNNIPQGWQICDGTNGTPDMRGNFAMGATSDSQINTSDGLNSITLTVAQMPKHNHVGNQSNSFTTTCNGSHSHTFSHTHSGTTGHAGDHYHTSGTAMHSGYTNLYGICTWSSGWVPDGGRGDSIAGACTSTGGGHSHSFTTGGPSGTSTSTEGCHTHNIALTGFVDAGENKAINITNKHKKVFYICKIE